MTEEPPDRRLARSAARRHGLFTRSDAMRAGATSDLISRRVSQGRWERVGPGVYRFGGAPGSWHQSLLTAVLVGGTTTAASHRSAAALAGLPPFSPGILEVCVPPDRRLRLRGVTAHRTADLLRADITVIEAIRVTTPTRTLIDLASVVPGGVLEEGLDNALRRGLTTVGRLARRLERLRRSGRPGVGAIDALLSARRDQPTESPLERRLLRLLVREGLPPPVCQHELREGGRVVARLDFAYPELMIAIEADGYEWHSGRARWQRDLARRNDLVAQGWQVLHVTAQDLRRRPEGVVGMVRRARAARLARSET